MISNFNDWWDKNEITFCNYRISQAKSYLGHDFAADGRHEIMVDSETLSIHSNTNP